MWLMQLGLARLRQEVTATDDWYWLVDHSVQLGRDRLLVVLGARLSEMPPPGQCLRRQDLQLLHLAVMADPNMHTNHQELVKVMARTGRPRVLLSAGLAVFCVVVFVYGLSQPLDLWPAGWGF